MVLNVGRAPGKRLVGHEDLRHYDPILVEKYKRAKSRSFWKNEEISGSFKVMTFFGLYWFFVQNLLPHKYFLAVRAIYQQMRDIRILEVITWGMAKKWLRNTDLGQPSNNHPVLIPEITAH